MVVKAVRTMPPPVAHMRVAFSPTAGGGAGKGIAGSEVLTIGVWIELRAAAGVVDHRLRLHRRHHRACRNDGRAQHCKFHFGSPDCTLGECRAGIYVPRMMLLPCCAGKKIGGGRTAWLARPKLRISFPA
jgi:hypothetical protein